MMETIKQLWRYRSWWSRHPIMYWHSEQYRRAVNLIAQMFIDEEIPSGSKVGLVNEQEGILLYAFVERDDDEP